MSSTFVSQYLIHHNFYRFIYIGVSALILFYVIEKVRYVIKKGKINKNYLKLVLYPQIFLVTLSIMGGISTLYISESHPIARSLWILSFVLPSIIMTHLIHFFRHSLEKSKVIFNFILYSVIISVIFLITSLLTWAHSYLLITDLQ